jgi:hypothetical protein
MRDVQKQREDIMKLEASMRLQDGFQEGDGPCTITHHFAPGVYLREMFMPKGTIVVGKIHKTEHICVLSQGMVSVSDGEKKITYEAPATIKSPIGAKRALYAHTDVTWTNVHPSPEYGVEHTDVKQIEDDVIIDSFEGLDKFLERAKQTLITEDRK